MGPGYISSCLPGLLRRYIHDPYADVRSVTALPGEFLNGIRLVHPVVKHRPRQVRLLVPALVPDRDDRPATQRVVAALLPHFVPGHVVVDRIQDQADVRFPQPINETIWVVEIVRATKCRGDGRLPTDYQKGVRGRGMVATPRAIFHGSGLP